MAVALATLPLKRLLAGAGDRGFTTGAGIGLAGTALLGAALLGTAGLPTGFAACLTGATSFFVTGLATGFVAVFLATALPTGTFRVAGFFGAAFLTTGFFTAAFFAAGFLAGLAFFAGGLGAAFLTAGLAACFFAVAGLATTFFAMAFFAGLAAARGVAAFLVALFTACPLVTDAFDLPALATCALVEIFPFCALAAFELRVVFAISLHHFLAVAAGCYSPSVLHQQARFWNTSKTRHRKPSRQREYLNPIDTVVAPFVQALAQSRAWKALPLPSQLLGLCTDCRRALRPMAWQPAVRLATATLSAVVHRRRRPCPRTLPFPALSLPERFPRCPLTG